MADNKDDDDSGEHTQYAPVRPPTLGQPPKKEEPTPAGGEDRTMAGGAPPPPLKPAAPPAAPSPPPPSSADEATDHTIADIPTAPTRPTPSAPPPAPPAGGYEEEGATIVIPQSQHAACSLQRVEPPGHGDIIPLSRTDYLLGRSRTCDIPLYSSTASREHARISKRGESWYLRPEEGKTVVAAGSTVSGEVKLVHKMRLQLGGDELLFFDERAATAPAALRASGAGAGVEGKQGSRMGLILAIVAVVLVIAAAAAYLLLLKP